MSAIKQNPVNKTKEFYQDFANTIATMIEQGTAPWQKPWKAGEFQLPYNPTSKKIYNGVNLLNLLSTGYNDPRFLTFNQVKKQNEDYHLRKGEKGHKVVYYEFTKKEPVLDENKNPVFDEEGSARTKTVSREFPIIKFFTVFNATQIDGMEALAKKEITWDANERAEELIKNSQALIVHDRNDRACFNPKTGKISLPDKSQFPSAENYYSTLLHELAHWTKFEEQVPRQISEDMDTKTKYAMEELRAEIATWRICTEIGLPFEPDQSVSYIEGWATATKVMRDDPYVLARACKDAEMIVSHLLGFDPMKIEAEKNITEVKNIAEVKKDAINFDATKEKSSIEREVPTEQEKEGMQKRDKRFYLDVPFNERREAKSVGAKWEKDEKKWYITNPQNSYDFKPWLVMTAQDLINNLERNKVLYTEKEYTDTLAEYKMLSDENLYTKYTSEELNAINSEELRQGKYTIPERKKITHNNPLQEKQMLFVPYHERNNAKVLGARWDSEEKSWYAPKGTELESFSRWLKQEEKTPISSLTAQEEFAQTLKNAGLVLDQAPIMDGQIHRVPVEKDNMRNIDGAYKGYLDGIPAGFYQNFSTGETNTWKYSGQEFSLEEKAQYKEIAIQQKEKNIELRKQEHEQAAKKAYGIWTNAPNWASSDNNYLKEKDVKSYGIKISDSNDLLIPIRNINGRIQSLQFIKQDGEKILLKHGQLQGGFHTIDPNKEIGQTPIIVTEGYATAATLHEISGQPTVSCFSSNNLLHVVQALREKFPHQEIQIMADDDYKNEIKLGINVGIKKAYDVAHKIENVKVFIPQFTAEEKVQGLSDFNDLTKSRGKDTVLEQLKEQNKTHKEQTKEKSIEISMAM